MDELPELVAATAEAELGGRTPDEVEMYLIEDMIVLYEVEYYEGDQEHEIYIYPNGELASKRSHAENDEGH